MEIQRLAGNVFTESYLEVSFKPKHHPQKKSLHQDLYYNIIIKLILKTIKYQYLFFKDKATLVFIKEVTIKAFVYWKIIEEIIPKPLNKPIDSMINNK